MLFSFPFPCPRPFPFLHLSATLLFFFEYGYGAVALARSVFDDDLDGQTFEVECASEIAFEEGEVVIFQQLFVVDEEQEGDPLVNEDGVTETVTLRVSLPPEQQNGSLVRLRIQRE